MPRKRSLTLSYQYLLGKVSTPNAAANRTFLLYQYLLGKVSTKTPGHQVWVEMAKSYQYLLGKVST